MFWSSFFEKKRKCQFIHIPFSVADVHVRNVTHLKEVAKEFEFCEFIEDLMMKFFNLEDFLWLT